MSRLWEEQRLDEVTKYTHDKHCDRDLCVSDCPYRKWAESAGRWYPGKHRGF